MDEQKELTKTIESPGGDVIELIQHSDYHHWIYFNGVCTDARYPRHHPAAKYEEIYSIFENFSYGESVYNKKRIQRFFKELIPEYFL